MVLRNQKGVQKKRTRNTQQSVLETALFARWPAEFQPKNSLFGAEDMMQSERIWDRLWTLLYTSASYLQVYVYRSDPNGQSIGSYIWKGSACPELPEVLRDVFRGGDSRVLIRQGRRMVFAGNISVERPRNGDVT